jgi:hypothetical protein
MWVVDIGAKGCRKASGVVAEVANCCPKEVEVLFCWTLH